MTPASIVPHPIRSVVPHDPAPIRTTYHRIDGANILLHEPAGGRRHDLLFVSMHGGLSPNLRSAFLERVAAHGIATAFCVPDSSSFVDQFRAMDRCMAFFRDRAGTVVLMGQSRGAGLMSGYQNIAENGAAAFQGPERRLPLPDLDLRPADGIALLDANFGFTVMHLLSLNPALTREWRATRVDPTLDAANPENGYAPDAGAYYDDDFRGRFLAAQRGRYLGLLDEAERRLGQIVRGDGTYSDNEPFIVPDGIGINNSPKLFAGDLRYLSHTKHPWPQLHRDGSITTEVVRSVRVDENNPALAGTMRSGFVSTVRDYLWTEVRVDPDWDYGEDHLIGVDFASCVTSAPGNVAGITVPSLFTGHTAGYEYIAAEWEYERSASADRTIVFTEGATHGWTPIDAERFGDTLDLEARLVVQWLLTDGRFTASTARGVAPGDDVTMPAAEDLRARLVGTWTEVYGTATARFAASGQSEVSLAVEATRWRVDDDGLLRFADRYGAESVDRFVLKGDELLLRGVRYAHD